MHARYATGVALAALAQCVTFSPSALGQILNIERRRLERPEDDYLVGNVGVNFNYTNRSQTLREPVRVMSTGFTSHAGYFAERTAYLLINDYQLLRVNENPVIDTGVTHLRVQLFRSDWLSYEGFTQYQYDRPRGLRFRGLLGAAARLAVLRSEDYDVFWGIGPMFEREHWTHPTEPVRVEAQFVKLSTYVSSRASLGEAADLNGVVYYQVGYDDPWDVYRQRVTGEVNLSVKVVGALSITSSFQAAYETRPLVPILSFIHETKNGLRLDF
jgi:hypothetical protein